MENRTSTDEPTPARQRADIDAGRKGDKTPGFDPAVAPMETDAEAGGDTTGPSANPQPDSRPRFRNEASFGDAMLPMVTEPKLEPGRTGPVMVLAGAAIVILVVVIAAALW